ncbi:MAG: type II toxin-antitoxin system VapC family toxin [Isosphaeraceae bacterium]
MKYLVDANVLSEATRPQPVASVLTWLGRHEAELAVNPIILGEIRYGILQLPAGTKRDRLLEWFAAGAAYLPVFDLDAETAQVWAQLLAELRRKGRAMPVKDSLIAATARQHRLTVVTRNTDDFAHAKVKLVNPFEGG